MKKKLLTLFPLFILLLALLFSCRNDLLAENDSRNKAENAALTSKIISLNESAHRSRILPELQFAKQKLAKKSTTAFGRVVNFGDSISIDTDNVIYIENGPNYHTYTFKINRTNPQPNDPVENLLLTPLPDGSYKEFLVSYNFTEHEKNTIKNGGYVDRKNKVYIVEMDGNLQSSLLDKAISSCFYEDVTVHISCSSGDHGTSNASSCTLPNENGDGVPPRSYTIVALVCADVIVNISPPTGAGTPIGTSPATGGGGGGAGSCTSCPPSNPTPDPCIEVPTTPTEVTPGLSNGGCLPGVPTLPNLGGSPKTNNPCAKIKSLHLETKFNEKVATIDNTQVLTYDHEMGFAAGYPPANTGVTGTQYQPMENMTGTHSVTLPGGDHYFGFIHSHTDDEGDIIRIKIFSNADVATFLTNCVRNSQQNGNISDAYAMVITSEGNYMLKYTGSGNYSIGPGQLANWAKWYIQDMNAIRNEDGTFEQSKVENAFLKFLRNRIKIDGIELYSIEKNTGVAKKMSLDSNNNTNPPITCPQ